MKRASQSRDTTMNGKREDEKEQWQEATEQILMENSEMQLGSLTERIGIVKQIGEEINIEITKSNALLDDMNVKTTDAQGLLKDAMGKLNQLVSAGSNRHMCYLIGFAVTVFLIVYFIVSYSKS